MKKLEVFDPPMCCSTGVCGPSVNSELVSFQALLTELKQKGIQVERYNLGHQADKFASNSLILGTMGESGEHLPIILVDGQVVFTGKYPSQEELANTLGFEFAKKTNSLKVL